MGKIMWQGFHGIKNELGKVWGNRLFLAVLVLFFFINLFCIGSAERKTLYYSTEYREARGELKTVPEAEVLSYVTEKKDESLNLYRRGNYAYFTWYQVYKSIAEEIQIQQGFSRYQEQLEERRVLFSNSAVFRGKNSFAERSAEKACKDYKDKVAPDFVCEASHGVEGTAFPLTGVLMCCVGLFVCMVLFLLEKEQGMNRLQWTFLYGRGRLLVYKVFALFFSCVFLTILFVGSNYIFMSAVSGFGTLHRDIRMVAAYYNSLFEFSVGQWLAVQLFWKTIALFLVLLVFAAVCSLTRNLVAPMIGFSCIIFLEYALYTNISSISVYASFRYINLIALFQVDEWLLGYRHMNLFGYPVTLTVCMFVLAAALFVSMVFFCFFFYNKSGAKQTFGKNRRIQRKKGHSGTRTTLFSWEIHKALFLECLLAFLVLGAGVMVVLFCRKTVVFQSVEDSFYKIYMQQLEGPVNERTEQKLLQIEKDVFAEKDPAAIQAYERVVERYQYLRENGGYFVYDTGYNKLVGADGPALDAWLAVWLMFVLCVIACSIMGYDTIKKMDTLLFTTIRGRKEVYSRKYLVAVIFYFLCFLAICMFKLREIQSNYGLPCLNAPAQSLPVLGRFAGLTLRGYLVLLYAVRFLSGILFIPCVGAIVKRSKSMINALSLCCSVGVCFPLLTVFGKGMKVFSYPVWGILGNEMLQCGWLATGLYLALLFGTAIICRRRNWQ